MEYFGNKEILKNYKVGFLCSRKVPANIILKTYDWAIEQRDKGICIVSGFHSKIEKDVFEILLKGEQPIIMILARALKKRWEKDVQECINNDRLLIISPFDSNVKRITSATAIERNKLVIDLSDEMYIPFSRANGNIKTISEPRSL